MERARKNCRVYPRVLVCVSAHESMLYLSYSFVALVKVIFLCGGIRRCGFCVSGTVELVVFCFCATVLHAFMCASSKFYNTIMLDERNHYLRQATTNHAVLNVVPLYLYMLH
jgi:hypothetical protein